MTDMIRRAKELRLPEHTTPEDLGCCYSKILDFGDKVIIAGYYYQGQNKPSYYGAVYEYLDDNARTCEDFIGLREVSEEYFEDDGHAIEWAIKNA